MKNNLRCMVATKAEWSLQLGRTFVADSDGGDNLYYPRNFKEIGLNLDIVLRPALKSFYNFTDKKRSAFIIKYSKCRSDKVVYQALLLYKQENLNASDIETHFLSLFPKAFDIVLSQQSEQINKENQDGNGLQLEKN